MTLLDFLRSYLGLGEHDEPSAAREKVAGKLLLLDPELAEALPLFFDLLGIPDPDNPAPRMEPETAQRRLFAAIQRLMQAQGRRTPVVSVIEDLHWIDGGSAGFLQSLVEGIARTRALVIVTFRPEYRADWMNRSYYQQVALAPLGRVAAGELLRDLLGSDPSLAALVERIHARTAGNPFFIEEVVQGLVERGSLSGKRGAYRLVGQVGESTAPATVQAVLAARIDRLADHEKVVLQTAAVIGKDFAEPVLRRVGGLRETELAEALRALTRVELLYETALYPQAEYSFKHPLTQEVAYRSQLGERRAATHGAVARALETVHADKLDEHAGLLAYQWECAGEKWTAAQWHARAANWIRVRDRREMDRHWRRVRTLLAEVPESSETLALGVLARRNIIVNGMMFGLVNEAEATTFFAEGSALASRLDDPAPRVRLLNAYANLRFIAGAVDEALAHLKESLRLAEQSQDDFLRFIVRVPLANVLGVSGRLREAIAFSDEAEALGRNSPALETEPGASPYGALLNTRIWALGHMGRLREAEQTIERALELGRARKDEIVLRGCHAFAVRVYMIMGDSERALGHARKAIEWASRVGDALSRVNALGALARAYLLNRKWPEAIEAISTAAGLRGQTGTGFLLEADDATSLAEAHLGAGNGEQAREASDRALALTRERKMSLTEIRALLAHARVLLATDGTSARALIADDLDAAEALIDGTGAEAWRPFVRVERAELARLAHDETTRQRELREAYRLFTEMGAPIRAAEVAKELGP